MAKSYEVLPAGCPVEKPKDRDASLIAIDGIRLECINHVGQPAIYHRQDRRGTIPILVTIEAVYPHFVLVKYPCYAPDGRFRQYLRDSISWGTLYCGDEALKFIDGDI